MLLLIFYEFGIKPIVLVSISSGIRVGSWDFLQWKHVVPMERDCVSVIDGTVDPLIQGVMSVDI
ncbi:MAG: hypothetical protein QOD17_05800 [Nitrososphaeraceae archaeon]|nr:hypothetical protein [Nitrososphaeraceae archaeon]MDW0278000.1 hypothetical protein [Nitrososphaeraceae archaeon]